MRVLRDIQAQGRSQQIHVPGTASLEAHRENLAKNVVGSGHLAKIKPLLVGPTDNGVIEVV
jgi:hypothetical protein